RPEAFEAVAAGAVGAGEPAVEEGGLAGGPALVAHQPHQPAPALGDHDRARAARVDAAVVLALAAIECVEPALRGRHLGAADTHVLARLLRVPRLQRALGVGDPAPLREPLAGEAVGFPGVPAPDQRRD